QTATHPTATTGTSFPAPRRPPTPTVFPCTTLFRSGATGLTPVTSGTIALGAGAAASIAGNAGGTSAPAGSAVTPPPSVIVKDANGNRSEGRRVGKAGRPGSGTDSSMTRVATGGEGMSEAGTEHLSTA